MRPLFIQTYRKVQLLVTHQQHLRLYLFMNINQSDKDSSKDKSKVSSGTLGFDSNNFFMYSQQTTSTKGTKKIFINSYRRIQIALSLLLVILATLWVQITVQRHGPFIRTAQCFFNEAVFLHDSQDIYEGTDVIYWRNGQYYSFKDMQEMFIRLANVSKDLLTNSLFRVNPYFILNDAEPQVDLLTIYKFDIPQAYHEYRTYNSTIDEMQTLINSTLLNRSFYEHLWKIQLSVIVPLVYRGDSVLMQLDFIGDIYSSMLMQYKMDVGILTEDQDILKYGKTFSENNLGVRKLNDAHNMSLSLPYIRWVILFLMVFVLIFEINFVLKKSKYIDQKVKQKIQQEAELQKLLDKIDQKVESNQSISSIGQFKSFIAKKREEQQQYKLPFSKKLQKIGYYYILEAAVTLLAFFGFVGDQNGLICFFCWLKIIVYLAQTKNRLMFGFLFEQTIPTYLRIYLNIILLITSFVLFNMLVLRLTKKFQTIQLGYFQYFFNYFQYGIYQNFVFVFLPFGVFSTFFYFIQVMLLLYVGNNILISILANQVSKNSYLSSVEEMIDKIKANCPACGVDFQDSRHNSQNNSQANSPNKQVMISKLVRDLQLQKMRSYSSMGSNAESQINIEIKSPVLSPFFPRKNQKRMSQDQFLSPKLKQRNLKNQMKQIHEKIKNQEISSESKLQAFEQLKAKLQPKKKIHIQLSDSKIQEQAQSKTHKKLRAKIELLFKKVQKFRQIQKSEPKKSFLSSNIRFTQGKNEVLNNLLQKIILFKQKVQSKIVQ